MDLVAEQDSPRGRESLDGDGAPISAHRHTTRASLDTRCARFATRTNQATRPNLNHFGSLVTAGRLRSR
jgi:hypothetical protein